MPVAVFGRLSRQSLGADLEFDISLMLNRREVRFMVDGKEKHIPVPPIEVRTLHEHDLSCHLNSIE